MELCSTDTYTLATAKIMEKDDGPTSHANQ